MNAEFENRAQKIRNVLFYNCVIVYVQSQPDQDRDFFVVEKRHETSRSTTKCTHYIQMYEYRTSNYKHVRVIAFFTFSRKKIKIANPLIAGSMFFQLVGIKNAAPLGFVVVVIPSRRPRISLTPFYSRSVWCIVDYLPLPHVVSLREARKRR